MENQSSHRRQNGDQRLYRLHVLHVNRKTCLHLGISQFCCPLITVFRVEVGDPVGPGDQHVAAGFRDGPHAGKPRPVGVVEVFENKNGVFSFKLFLKEKCSEKFDSSICQVC